MSQDKVNKARARAKRLISELQGRTVERGFTEAEALEAVEKIGKLMEDHDIELGEIGIREEAGKCAKNEVFAADDFASTLIVGIGAYCTLKVYQTKGGGHGVRYSMFGLPHDLEIGVYLYEVLCDSMEEEWGRFMERNGYSMKKRQSFRMGFAARVCERLKVLKAERDARTYKQTGTALVVVKDQIVQSEFDKLGMKLREGARQTAADPNAYMSGRASGERANLNSPLSGGVSQDRIR